MGCVKSVHWDFCNEEQGEESMKRGLFMYTEAGDKKEPVQWVIDIINKIERNRLMSMLYDEENFPAMIECLGELEKKYGKDCFWDNNTVKCPQGCLMKEFNGNHPKYQGNVACDGGCKTKYK